MKNTIFVSLTIIAGCAPLQQAPLMYTSKQVFGVDISAPTTESTGVTMNLGFKNVDAAYVPVAVSKKSEDGGKDIIPITASYGKGDGRAEEKDESEIQRIRVDKLREALSNEAAAATALATIKAENDAINEYDTKFAIDKDQARIFVENSKSFSPVTAERIKQSADAGNPIPADVISTMKEAQGEAQKKYDQAKGAVQGAKDELAESLYVTRRDAMSVYGSFGSSTGGNSNSITNKLGKMFSTGVAAQNLTEGIAEEGRGLAIGQFLANCIKIAEFIDNEQEKEKFSEDCAKAAIAKK
ncbi:hypothetical protein VUJ49_11385 [Pseudomonas berkeleyensis]|uniref:Lipoprotein n=1 Tax=Pseudomonas berkeleyensis TaxID=2726956 RepID=A0A7G5DV29_9PSED|nr:hypothetical protein [Pseudomonas berkeleyensis]QMV65604.1 hypothetical protein HS968_11340 [Pseudomonas berkeleyensis]WSO41087.1 hypothetical protein VUJ49_11385 [Pseudomonas berkeleyensis]